MTVLSFADFARRRSEPERSVERPVTDRWALLHAPTAARPVPAAPVALRPARDFWGDLLLKLAYPSYRQRSRRRRP